MLSTSERSRPKLNSALSHASENIILLKAIVIPSARSRAERGGSAESLP
jgi:hypothetical protein